MLPPPLTGAGRNLAQLIEELRARGIATDGISTAANLQGSALRRSWRYHLARVRHFIANIRRLRELGGRGAGRPVLLMAPDGGFGAFYSAAYATVARSRYRSLILTHHSFRYIDRPTWAMRIICRAFRGEILHVFLSPGMQRAFAAVYGEQASICVSNARYVSTNPVAKQGEEMVLGHLSNLAVAKGFPEVAATFRALHQRGVPVRLLLAGPVHDARIEPELSALLREFPDAVEYLGPVHGSGKDDFYRRVKVFLFPTRWPQEAQPHVVFEALASGAAVISFERGVIAEMIPESLGLTIPGDADFVSPAVSYVMALVDGSRTFPPAEDFRNALESEARGAEAANDRLLDFVLAQTGSGNG